MKGTKPIIKLLNAILKNELTAINQYFLHARMLEDWGFTVLGGKVYHEAIGEMKHADRIIKRILFLEGLPNLQDLGKLSIGEDVVEILKNDLAMESAARLDVVAAIDECETDKDYVTRELLTDIITDSEEHIDFLETELALVDKVGLHNYLQSQSLPSPQ
ncbi:MAG: bacterioferritin [Rhodospirillales bacterium]|jgi:bacterioferritin|nr:bacterioferritin [Rhodospirillales bacterium]